MDQFSTNIQNEERNKKVKGIIGSIDTDSALGVRIKHTNYWAMYDDVAIAVTKTDELLLPGKYVKMYGSFATMIFTSEQSEYRSVKKDSDEFRNCEKVAKIELNEIVPHLRTRHSGTKGG
jgi:hypothetical protein